MATGSLSIIDDKLRFSGHGFTPGSYVGVIIRYAAYDRLGKRTGRFNIKDGKIINNETDNPNLYLWEVNADGSIVVAMGLHLVAGNDRPGLVLATMSSTAGEMVDDETDI